MLETGRIGRQDVRKKLWKIGAFFVRVDRRQAIIVGKKADGHLVETQTNPFSRLFRWELDGQPFYQVRVTSDSSDGWL